MKKLLFSFVMLGAFAFMTSCSSSSDGGSTPPPSDYGVPADAQAGQAPTVTTNNVTIPNISAPSIESNGAVGNISMTGIKGIDGNFLSLAGTGDASQNIWMSIDGVAKSIAIVNGNDVAQAPRRAQKKGLADIVFLIDNSGSMGEEADKLAQQVLDWSQKLAAVVDCKFGCVGYGDNSYGVDGGMDLADISELVNFLNNRSGYTYGTYRTYGFYGPKATELETKALSSTGGYYNGSYNECGVVALYFANDLFSWRDGANRIYINFTDEPNQPNNLKQWSVETLNSANTEIYNWNAAKGTVHSVYSGTDVSSYEAGGYYYPASQDQLYWYECPWLMSDYTGGLTLKTDPYFTNFKLDDIEVTGAILSTYILRFNITDDLRSGLHNIILTVKDKNGSMAKKEFKNVSFGG